MSRKKVSKKVSDKKNIEVYRGEAKQTMYWCFTSWEDPQVDKLPNFATYIVYGRELTQDNVVHWQGYVECSTKFRGCTISNKFRKEYKCENIKLLPRYKDSNGDHCSKYAKKGLQSHEEWELYKDKGPNYGKDALIVEFGKLTKSEQGKRNDLIGIVNMIESGVNMRDAVKNGDIVSFPAVKSYQALLPLFEPKRKLDSDPDVIVFWGSTSCGKSHTAHEMFPDAYTWEVSEDNEKWWQGYDGHRTVIIDDFRDTLVKFNKMLKILQKFPMQVETKGGSRQLLADKFIITCNTHPHYWYKWMVNEDKNQLLSRITDVREFNTKFERKGHNKYCVEYINRYDVTPNHDDDFKKSDYSMMYS